MAQGYGAGRVDGVWECGQGGFLEEVEPGLCGVQAVWEPLPMTRGLLSPL